MKIYKDYSTDELVMGKPCIVDGVGEIYPILIKEYKEFQRYLSYLVFNERHLKLPEEMFLLQGIIINNLANKSNGNLDLTDDKVSKELKNVLIEMENLFSMLTHRKIYHKVSPDGFEFSDIKKDDTTKSAITINNKTFDIMRKVVLKMNLLIEPKIYEREIDRKWEEKALVAKRTKSIELGEILTIVRSNTKESYEVLSNQNIFQLYSDYYWLQHGVNFETERLFATVSDKIKVSQYIDNIVDVLYKDPTSNLNVGKDFMKQFE